jgi:FAD dependent oxidoreductase TIGR03364
MDVAEPYDDAVIGAGILGLAHAYQLARRGRRVVVFERHSRAEGASVRNFGMVWPIGQAWGPMRDLALNSREIWLELLRSSGLWHDSCGSLHLAYRDDEAEVLKEFFEQSRPYTQSFRLLGPAETLKHTRVVKRDGLQLALFSPLELCVDPREVVAFLPGWLKRQFGVEFQFRCPITVINSPKLYSGPREWSAKRCWICCGDELSLLYPDQLESSGVVRCKLQMMRSQPAQAGWRIGPSLAAGLTLRHYPSFRDCPSLAALKQRIADESPWFDRFGIHVLVAQNGRGELTIGDSHEYGDAIEPFDKGEIDEWILGYLKTFLDAHDLRIAARWHGTYAKHPAQPYVILKLAPDVVAVTGVGGAGLTLSFGLAELIVKEELGTVPA